MSKSKQKVLAWYEDSLSEWVCGRYQDQYEAGFKELSDMIIYLRKKDHKKVIIDIDKQEVLSYE